ncbi:hypothetical protein CCH79_00000424, partial [Gambusia affinis]
VTQPVNDYWGEFGPYGPCSRTCGTGVAMRTRRCITSRTDGGHNCVGSSKSFLTCNTHACPVGSRDFREEQCSEFDGMDFQGKRHTWVPYYGASNPCELNCVPRGQNFFYRHRPTVVDGTPCYVGRTDICVDGVCRLLDHREFMGLDNDTVSVHSSAPVAVSPHPRDTRTYIYRAGVYGECSATCDGGMQYRSVECWVQDPSNPHVVDESYCITQRLQRPQSQQACSMHPCAAAKFSASSFSVCSVTCGEGQQTREVVCVGARGEHLPDHACRGLARPASVQTCRRPACPTHISWHVTEFGLCSRSCGGGVRERKVGCFDADLNPFSEDHCGFDSRPISVETCNAQPCNRPQTVPSIQESGAGRGTIRFVPHVPGEQSGHPCVQSLYGCCPDGHTPATGPRSQGCTQDDCVRSRYGCCLDGVTPARGFGMAGCPEYQTPGGYDSNPRETLTYIYRAGVYSECSASCDGGVQYRSVECLVQDPSNPRVVDESYCIAHRLQKPLSQQPCNRHPCAAAEYSVSSFSGCSVTCGEGQQTREVVCVGARGEHLPDHACRGLARPASVQTCRRPACHTHISWHVTEFGLCTRSCGGGVRERKVGCFDTDLNPYPEERCGEASRPLSVESCNTQPCPGVQMFKIQRREKVQEDLCHMFQEIIQFQGQTHTVSGDRTLLCTVPTVLSHFMAAVLMATPLQLDLGARAAHNMTVLKAVTPAPGVGRAGCPEFQTTEQRPSRPADPSSGNICLLPSDEGPCDNWMVRFVYNYSTGKCKEFWYGGCHGNANNFRSMEACRSECEGVSRGPAPPRGASRRGSLGSIARARAQRSRLQ